MQVYKEIYGSIIGKRGFTQFVFGLHPRSSGSVRLRSQNPFDLPVIDPQYLSDDSDLDVLLEGALWEKKIDRVLY